MSQKELWSIAKVLNQGIQSHARTKLSQRLVEGTLEEMERVSKKAEEKEGRSQKKGGGGRKGKG